MKKIIYILLATLFLLILSYAISNGQTTTGNVAVTIPRVWLYLKVNAYSETDTAITFNLSIFRTKGKFAQGQSFQCDVPQALPAYPVPANGNVTTANILAYIKDWYVSQGYVAAIK